MIQADPAPHAKCENTSNWLCAPADLQIAGIENALAQSSEAKASPSAQRIGALGAIPIELAQTGAQKGLNPVKCERLQAQSSGSSWIPFHQRRRSNMLKALAMTRLYATTGNCRHHDWTRAAAWAYLRPRFSTGKPHLLICSKEFEQWPRC